MNLADLKRRVYAALRDSDKSFFSDAEVEDWLNDAYIDLATRLRILQKKVVGTTTDDEIDMPSDCVQVLSLRLEEDDVEFVDDATWNAFSDAAGNIQHTIGRVFAGKIELYPDPGFSAYELRYSYSPAPLDTPEDVPALPAHLHSRLTQYAIAMCRYKEGQMGDGDRMMGLYESALPAPALGAINLRPGPLTVGMAPTPFDSDPDTIHR